MGDPIDALAETGFRWRNCQALLYNEKRSDIFPAPFLYRLYERTVDSGHGALRALFCGAPDLSNCDAVCRFLRYRSVCVMGVWQDTDGERHFRDLGYAFLSFPITRTSASTQENPQNSGFAGYMFFPDAWGTGEQTVCMVLALAWFFHRYKMIAIHGTRYSDNHLTARFTSRFGFKDDFTVPHCLLRSPDEPLQSATLATLLRVDFIALAPGLLSNSGEESVYGQRQRWSQ